MIDIDYLAQQAVDAAIADHWDQAVELNNQIIKEDPQNIEAYLRQGFAYLQKENIKLAKKHYQHALKIQPKNPVASENLERISILEETGSKNPIKVRANLNPSLFLEVPGKTKSITLVNLGQKNSLAELDIGEKVDLKLKRRKLEVRSTTGEYIGYLPDDVSKRLIFFLEAKSVYTAYIKEANPTKVVIFVKEEHKGPKVAHYSSFPANAMISTTPRDVDEDAEGDVEGEEEDEYEKILGGATEGADSDEETKSTFHLDREEEEEDTEE